MGLIDSAVVSSPDIGAAIERGLVAVLPVGALEQHGPHLPLATDTILAEGLARQIAEKVDGWLLPAVSYGEAWTAEGWAGTLSLSADTLVAVVEDLGRGLKRMGLRGLVTVNGHFGNREPIGRAARRLHEAGLPVLMLDYPGLEAAATGIVTSQPAGPGFYHADEVETSMLLALRPHAVRMDLAVAEYPAFPATFGMELMPLSTFNKSGVFGDPRLASAAKGEAIIGRVVEESVRLIGLWRKGHAP